MSSADSIIVLDIDGTLTDSVRPHQIAFEQALRSFPFPALSTDWGQYQHHSDSGIFYEAWELAGFNGKPDLIQLEEQYRLAYDQVLAQHPVTPVAGASAFIASLSQTWGIVFATGSLRSGALHKLSVIGIDPDDFILITASEFHTREEIVQQAVQAGSLRYQIRQPQRVISIGDGIWDLKTARNLGYEFLGIGEGTKAEQLRTSGATVYADFNDLLADYRQIFSAQNSGETR
ncbi:MULTISPECIES: HAD family hydrolase [Erwinia]|uniref:phosphoglycolate phosphatase n=1 Tax=Erwinia rhapontici TaxID=55212 RepID=A0ABM7N7F9_ERWRD|nr:MULTISPECIES: HAD family hydrolase [Erwinia]MCS3609687.1 phosphoglycolate phosphatase-like HAD superfamily hydrolase [Erwinia rhapontici]NNS09703.1 HAD family hydrolase [Erwinia sp. JH02]BCQ37389.1 hypothetical protein ERHA53_47320 [Erwinia rhapontici]